MPPVSPRLVILISGRGSNMQAIAEACASGRLPATVAAVISNRPLAAGLDWAAANGIEAVSIDHKAYAERERFDADLADAIALREPDWIVLAGFMRVLGPAFVERFAGRLVNIHPSLLPLYPGLHTHQRALSDGALIHGATVHLVTSDLDHGPIVAQAAVAVRPDDDADRLAARVLGLEHRLYLRALDWLVTGRATVRDGRVLIDGGRTLAGRLLVEPGLVESDLVEPDPVEPGHGGAGHPGAGHPGAGRPGSARSEAGPVGPASRGS